MAITWNVQITVLNVERREVSITAVRTDSEDPDNPQVCRIISALIATTEQKVAVLNGLWAQHLMLDQRAAEIEAFVGTLESAAVTNLEARE